MHWSMIQWGLRHLNPAQLKNFVWHKYCNTMAVGNLSYECILNSPQTPDKGESLLPTLMVAEPNALKDIVEEPFFWLLLSKKNYKARFRIYCTTLNCVLPNSFVSELPHHKTEISPLNMNLNMTFVFVF